MWPAGSGQQRQPAGADAAGGEVFGDADYDTYGNGLHDDDGANDDQDDDGPGLEGGLGILLQYSRAVGFRVFGTASACLVLLVPSTIPFNKRHPLSAWEAERAA